MATPDGYYLSPSDHASVQKMIAWFRRSVTSRPNRPPFDPEDGYQAPETYVVIVPSGGIPALEAENTGTGGDIPGSAVCTVIQINRVIPFINGSQAGPVTVYNVSDDVIPAGYALATRDKFGTWVAVPRATSTTTAGEVGGDDCKGLHWLRSNKCLTFTVTEIQGMCQDSISGGSTTATEVGTSGVWLSDDWIRTGMGFTDFEFTPGAPPTLVASQTPGTGSGDVGTAYGPVALSYLGCVGDTAAFVGGGVVLCPGTADPTCDETFIVIVECTTCPSPDIEVCDDPAYTAARRLCFHTHEIVVLDAGQGGAYTVKGDATGVPFVITLDYKATYSTVDWADPYEPTSASLPGPAEHWWYGESTGIVTASSSPQHPVGSTAVFQMFLYKSIADCDGYFAWVRGGNNLSGLPAYAIGLSISGGPPNPFPYSGTSEVFTHESGTWTAAEVVVSENVCPDDLDPPTGGDFGCLDGPGEALEGVENLQVMIPDGASAGSYTATLNHTTGEYEFIPAGVGAATIKCLPSTCSPTDLRMVNEDTGSGRCAASVVTTPSFLAIIPGALFGGVGDIEVTI